MVDCSSFADYVAILPVKDLSEPLKEKTPNKTNKKLASRLLPLLDNVTFSVKI